MKRYHDTLIQALKSPVEAAGYLNAALEAGDTKMFLVALKNVAEAQGGMVKLSQGTKLNRANLYRILSKEGNPEVRTLSKVLNQFGLGFTITVRSKDIKKAA